MHVLMFSSTFPLRAWNSSRLPSREKAPRRLLAVAAVHSSPQINCVALVSSTTTCLTASPRVQLCPHSAAGRWWRLCGASQCRRDVSKEIVRLPAFVGNVQSRAWPATTRPASWPFALTLRRIAVNVDAWARQSDTCGISSGRLSTHGRQVPIPGTWRRKKGLQRDGIHGSGNSRWLIWPIPSWKRTYKELLSSWEWAHSDSQVVWLRGPCRCLASSDGLRLDQRRHDVTAFGRCGWCHARQLRKQRYVPTGSTCLSWESLVARQSAHSSTVPSPARCAHLRHMHFTRRRERVDWRMVKPSLLERVLGRVASASPTLPFGVWDPCENSGRQPTDWNLSVRDGDKA